MNGMEMMVASLLRAAGLDPVKIQVQVLEHADKFQKSLELLNAQLALISARLEAIERCIDRDAAGEKKHSENKAMN